jgi:hypothetical protein
VVIFVLVNGRHLAETTDVYHEAMVLDARRSLFSCNTRTLNATAEADITIYELCICRLQSKIEERAV